MPPEQAAGAEVDARGDVYALGAILYEVLAGAPPYRGTRAADVVELVRTTAPRPIAELAPAIPADLASIVGKSMQRDPAARYASAKSLADDLRRFAAGQLVGARRYSLGQLVARWLRRYRVVVATAAIALAITSALTVTGVLRIMREQATTGQALGLAEQRRLEAEDLVSFMLVDLSAKLCGKQLLEDVATKVADYYRSRGDATKLATTLEILAEAHVEHGRMPDAIDDMREAAGIRQGLVWQDVADGRRGSLDVSIGSYLAARDKLGLYLQRAGRADAARAEFALAVADGERLLAAHASRTARERLAWAHDRLASALLDGGDLADARAHHDRATALSDELLADAPRSVDFHFAIDLHVEYAGRVAATNPLAAAGELAAAATIAQRMPGLDPAQLAQADPAALRALVAQYRSERDDQRSALDDDRVGPPACDADNEAYLSAVGHYYMGLAAETDHDAARACSELDAAVAILDRATPLEHKPNVRAAMSAERDKYRQRLDACGR